LLGDWTPGQVKSKSSEKSSVILDLVYRIVEISPVNAEKKPINSLVFLVLSRFVRGFSSFPAVLAVIAFDSSDQAMKNEFYLLQQMLSARGNSGRHITDNHGHTILIVRYHYRNPR
jgi:hypothetical protein